MTKNISLKKFLIPIGIFFIYSTITAVIFHQRLPYLFTHYAMPDVDTDGGLWYKWFLYYTQIHQLPYDVIYLTGYPFGYDISLSPISNIIYSFQVFILTVIGFSWSNLIFITNLFSLLTYPLSGMGAYFLGTYITKNKMVSFFTGIIYAFSFYHIFMGRGQMSINHIEIIPFYFLSLLYFLDRKNAFSLLLSTTVFSVMFMADAYYAFFSGIFSFIVLLLYKDDAWKLKIKIFIIYYLTLFITLCLLNFNFIFSNLYLFNKTQAAVTGRNSIPRNELSDLLYFYSPIKQNLLYMLLSPLNYLLYLIPIFLVALGAITMSRKRIFMTYLACLCLAVILSTYVPGFYWVNELYFKYFGMFRGVGRLILLAYLFIGLLVGMTLNYFWKYLKNNKIYQIGMISALTILAIFAGMPNDSTWNKMTDFSKLAQIYQPIKNNPNIHTIAVYPFNLNFDNTGFPQPYQLLGQIIDEKPFTNGAAFYDNPSIAYQKAIKNIQNPKTVSLLAENGIDTIIIYNKLLPEAATVNKLLLSDKRVTFVGRYSSGYDGGYISANELSRDVSVYSIKKVQQVGVLKQSLFITSLHKEIPYTKVSPYVYIIRNVKDNSPLLFSYPYSDKWQMYPGDLSQKNSFSLLAMQGKGVVPHQRYHGYENLWKPTASGSVYTIIFQPYVMASIGMQVNGLVLVFLTICMLFLGVRQIKKNA